MHAKSADEKTNDGGIACFEYGSVAFHEESVGRAGFNAAGGRERVV